MFLSREDAISQIDGSWLLEIGGDDTFRRAYDAMWTNGPPDWTAEKFEERWKWMRRMLPKLHAKDIAVIWSVSCGGGQTVQIDSDGNYQVA